MSNAISKMTDRRVATSNQVDSETLARLRAAAAMPEAEIDLTDTDAPLTLDWSGAERGRYFKPVKRHKSFRIDADVLAWFEAQGKGYQALVNRALREAMIRATVSDSDIAAKTNAPKRSA